ncbi:MAG: hypothetical protein Q8R82_23070 [Hyphomonadaceae bacterium]|nr:hypothetical protein [Hyphomonadaceae bacterium]
MLLEFASDRPEFNLAGGVTLKSAMRNSNGLGQRVGGNFESKQWLLKFDRKAGLNWGAVEYFIANPRPQRDSRIFETVRDHDRFGLMGIEEGASPNWIEMFLSDAEYQQLRELCLEMLKFRDPHIVVSHIEFGGFKGDHDAGFDIEIGPTLEEFLDGEYALTSLFNMSVVPAPSRVSQ